ncbi:uncharacterized protein O3C94_018921 [Discoglossus pictus]
MVGRKVAIVSREDRESYKWLIRYLRTFLPEQNVQPVYISSNRSISIRDKVAGFSFAILYHSKNRGRVNVTDVLDALYDEELNDLSTMFGKMKVVVVIDDLEDGSYGEKIRILQSQPSIERLAQGLLIFSAKEKVAYTENTSDLASSDSAKKKLISLQKMITVVNAKFQLSRKKMVKKVGVLSREGQEHYKWFTNFLLSFLSQADVIPIYISNSNPYKHWEEISKCSFVILYHSKKRGRINVTDVTDSLYNDELQSLSRELGKTNVIVLIDDLDEGTDDEKNRILGNQPSIKSLASELFIFSVEEKAAYTNNSSHLELYGSAANKLQKIKGLIQRKQHLIEQSEDYG